MTLPDLPPVEGVRGRANRAELAALADGREQMVVGYAVPTALEALGAQYHIGRYAEAMTMGSAATAISMAPQLIAVEPSATAEPGAIDPTVARQAVDAAYEG